MRGLAKFSYRHRIAIVVLAVVAAIAAAAYGAGVFGKARPFGFDDPAAESSRAYEALEGSTGQRPVPGVLLLVNVSPSGTARGTRIATLAGQLRRIQGIGRVATPAEMPSLASTDRRLVLIEGFLGSNADDPSDVGGRVEDSFGEARGVVAGGPAVAAHELNSRTEHDLRTIELFAAPLLLLISLIVFRGLIAAMLPLVVGGLAIAFTLAALRALTEVTVVDLFALNVVTVLGLGLAIDYSLFMVSRYREEMVKTGATEETLAATTSPIGRMICFSAATVAGAVASLAVFPQDFLRSTGIGCALVAILSAAVVILVLPAVLGLLGERVNALAIGGPPDQRERAARWRRIGAAVLRHPLLAAVAVTAVMVAVGLPFLRAELTRADARVLPEGSSARTVEETVRQRFRGDPSATLLVVLPPNPNRAKLATARRKLAESPGVIAVSARRIGGRAVIDAQTSPSPFSDAGTGIVDRARALGWGGEALVTGASAELVDQRASLRSHLPVAIAIVLAVTTIALILMTGSVVLPLLALVGNALTVGAAFGLLVVIFQDNRLEGLLNYQGVGALDTSVPILLFAVIFGLSTDYGIFLFSRVAEARHAGIRGRAGIARGLEATGTIITAAAVLFAVAMGSFVFSGLVFIKEVAVGTAAAVLIDAILVRTLLLPSLMALCGRWAWWGPSPMRRFR